MNNFAVARVFTRIADLMELKGENAFKIRAYRNAAQTMQELTESLQTLAERGELKTIPGVGDAIADKTRDILATGTTKLYEKLKEEVPESLVELLALPAFGPKKIQTVWSELGIRDLDQLEQAARAHQLQAIPGFAAKSEEKLLQSIEAYRRRRERTPIAVVLPYAEGLARMLLETGAFTRLEIAGSVRRRKDLVGNIDLVGAAGDPSAALRAFREHPEISEVLEEALDQVCVRTHNGMVVDLRVVPPGAFGSALQRFTGSVGHNTAVAELARGRGGGWGDHGVTGPDAGSGFADEAEVYGFLGLPVVPAELREGWGEVEAAREERLPRLIEVSDIRAILHAHSTWSDGSATIARMAEAARALGYQYHANTDHSKVMSITRGLDEERLVEQMAEIDALNATFTDGFRVLKGIECDILYDGALDLPPDLLRRLDFVIGSVHLHQKMPEEEMTQRIVRALDTGVICLLAHPTGRILGSRDSYKVDMERVMDAAVANRVAMEINAFPDRLDMDEVHARRARERGIPISVNTDAHRPEHLSMLKYGIWQARRAWLEPDDVINTWPLERLTRWLSERKA
jgi:DNA polymerase (family 10)